MAATIEIPKTAIRDWSDGRVSVSLLVTGSLENRQAWAFKVWPDVLDARGKTTRVWLHCVEDANDPELGAEHAIREAIAAAEQHDVTIQFLCSERPDESTRKAIDTGLPGVKVSVADMVETYPVAYLNSRGQKWEPKRK